MFALTMLSGQAFAADPEFAGTKKDAEVAKKSEGSLAAEFGGALTTGNSEFYTLSSGLNGRYKRGRHQVKLTGGAVIGRARVDGDGDGSLSDAERSVQMSENARRFFGDLRYDFFLSEKDSLYILYGAFHDPFAGYDYRMHEQVGYSRKIVGTKKATLFGELGFDIAQEDYIESVEPNFALVFAARGMVSFKYNFSDSVGIEDTLEAFLNVLSPEDLRVQNNASLVAALGSKISLKLSHSLLFDNVPVGWESSNDPNCTEGSGAGCFRKLDQTMQVTLVASIL